MLRDDWDTALPTNFQIGAMDSFETPFLDEDFFSEFSKFVKLDSAEGDRRGFASIVAMSGWGKTYAMTLLAKLTTACRMTTSESNDPVLKELRALVSRSSNDIEEQGTCMNQASVDLLKRCIPLAITLNSSMQLELAKGTVNYDKEIAVRLAYVYLADPTETDFPEWRAQIGDASLTCKDVLTGLVAMAKPLCGGVAPIMLLLIDEPDHAEGARDVLSTLQNTAMRKGFSVDCRVVLSALEQEWLFAYSGSSRPIHDLQTLPPTQQQLADILEAEIQGRLVAGINEKDVTEVVNYIAAFAAGHWRTISTAVDQVTGPNQLTVQGLKLAVGRSKVYVPSFWAYRISSVMTQLEEALAHCTIGSKLCWMEPLSDGTAWQAITSGVIQRYLGTYSRSKSNKVVPIVSLLLLQSLIKPELPGDTSFFVILSDEWHSQSSHEVRDSLLRNVLATARFVPSVEIRDNVADHQLYDNMAAQFMLLRWDAYCRIDGAVRRRWSLSAEKLLRTPDSVKATKENPNYKVDEVVALRDAANQAWSSSLGITTTPTDAPTNRPFLCLVPSESDLENDLRLHVFRGATVCTAKNMLQVHSPDPEQAEYFKCETKLTTKGASVINNSPILPQGSVVEPAAGNDGFDMLVLLKKASGGWAIALIENKFESSIVAIDAVKAKLDLLKKYRGVLWKDQGVAAPTSAAGLGLPCVDETDVVWVLLADKGWTNDLPSQILGALNETGAFRGHVLLIKSDDFFGPCFGRIGILDRNTAAKRLA
eukprot:scaffold56720_cov56-Attheya_sp.AAC.5